MIAIKTYDFTKICKISACIYSETWIFRKGFVPSNGLEENTIKYIFYTSEPLALLYRRIFFRNTEGDMCSPRHSFPIIINWDLIIGTT